MQHAAEGARIQVEDFRRPALAFNHPIGLLQHRFNVSTLHIFERSDAIFSGSSRANKALTPSEFGFRISDFGFRISDCASARRLLALLSGSLKFTSVVRGIPVLLNTIPSGCQSNLKRSAAL